MYWMDAEGLYTVEPPTRKLRKAPEINTLTFRPTFVISRSGVRIHLPPPNKRGIRMDVSFIWRENRGGFEPRALRNVPGEKRHAAAGGR